MPNKKWSWRKYCLFNFEFRSRDWNPFLFVFWYFFFIFFVSFLFWMAVTRACVLKSEGSKPGGKGIERARYIRSLEPTATITHTHRPRGVPRGVARIPLCFATQRHKDMEAAGRRYTCGATLTLDPRDPHASAIDDRVGPRAPRLSHMHAFTPTDPHQHAKLQTRCRTSSSAATYIACNANRRDCRRYYPPTFALTYMCTPLCMRVICTHLALCEFRTKHSHVSGYFISRDIFSLEFVIPSVTYTSC